MSLAFRQSCAHSASAPVDVCLAHPNQMQPEATDHFKIEKLSGISDTPRLEAYLKLSDGWTTPLLSSRVDLSEFTKKILLNGVAIMAVDAGYSDIGVAAFYCNDPIGRCAYLTHLGVTPEHRGYGVGKALLDHVKAHAKSMGMASMMLEVYKKNDSARRFYLSSGFIETTSESNPTTPESVYMICSLE